MNNLKPTEIIPTGKIITLALMAGATMFLGVVVLITFSASGEKTAELDHGVFTIIVMGVWLASRISIGLVVPKLEARITGEKAQQAYLTSHIVRMALNEGPALFGCVGLIIFAPKAELEAHPELLLLLVPYLSLILTGLVHFPSQNKLDEKKRRAEENKAFAARIS